MIPPQMLPLVVSSPTSKRPTFRLKLRPKIPNFSASGVDVRSMAIPVSPLTGSFAMFRSILKPRENPFLVSLVIVASDSPPQFSSNATLIVTILVQKLSFPPKNPSQLDPEQRVFVVSANSLMGSKNPSKKCTKTIKISENVRVTYDKLKRNNYLDFWLMRSSSVRHVDYVDTRTKIILQNRLFIDELLGKSQVMSRITRALDSNDESVLPGTLRNGKHRDQSSPERRMLRSKSTTNTLDDNSTPQQPDKVNPYHIRLLMTNPYIVSWSFGLLLVRMECQ